MTNCGPMDSAIEERDEECEVWTAKERPLAPDRHAALIESQGIASQMQFALIEKDIP